MSPNIWSRAVPDSEDPIPLNGAPFLVSVGEDLPSPAVILYARVDKYPGGFLFLNGEGEREMKKGLCEEESGRKGAVLSGCKVNK